MRITLLEAAAAGALTVALTGALPASGHPVGSAQYLVEPDPRLCPSPLCGGYWVSLVNRHRSRCHEGELRGRCYVAMAVDELRRPLETTLPAGALVRAAIDGWSGAFGLGALVVADVRAPVGKAVGDAFYSLRETRVRCVHGPCFSIRASRLNTSFRTTLSRVDLGPARANRAELARAQIALRATDGLFVSGRIVRTADGGRRFRASQLFLRAAPPRA